MNENEFNQNFDKKYADKMPNFDANLNIAVVGKVSSGKSSLINAILLRKRSDPVAPVGPESGITKEVTAYQLDEKTLIVDCPGLDDVRRDNSKVTEGFLEKIDLGLFVVTGSADASQKENFEDLKKNAEKVIVVLNKIDEWDHLKASKLEDVKRQWREVLGIDEIYGTCTIGYDSDMREDIPMDIRGVGELMEVIFNFLELQGKAILFARHQKNKNSYALKIIAVALVAVIGEAFLPGSTAYITATQVTAITSLNYLYTGEILSKSSALAILPVFIGQSIGTNTFLLVKSMLPPTGVLDVAAAGIAVLITFAMLAAVKYTLENDHNLKDSDFLKDAFGRYWSSGAMLKNIPLADWKSEVGIMSILKRLLGENK